MMRAALGLIPLALLALAGAASAQSASGEEAYAIAKDAYVYAYPLMLTHATVQKLSNFAEPIEGDAYGPPNQFHHVRQFADPEAKVVIRTAGGGAAVTCRLSKGSKHCASSLSEAVAIEKTRR